jgi:pantoate--beta-alanine ligase
MERLITPQKLDQWVADCREKRHTIGFVPTMGALHAGHISLVRQARIQTSRVVVSIFVNPTQFGPNEDFTRYPRTLAADEALLASAGCDALFLPAAEDIYPPGHQTRVTVPPLNSMLCGGFRPGHFDGVATVVALLFHLVKPQRAYFGTKDYQQYVLIRRMVTDLHMPVAVIGLPTVREPDGLALSSRNRYLNPGERQQATALYRALCHARTLRQNGIQDASLLEREARAVLEQAGIDRIDYVAVRDPETLVPLEQLSGPAVLLIAAHVGPARLIDNALLS